MMSITMSFALALTFVCNLNADIVDNSGGALTIPDDDPNGVTDVISIGVNEVITDVEVTLRNATHDWVGDLVVTITSPNGTTADIMVRTGGGLGDSTNIGADYTFSDSAIGVGETWWEAADNRSNSDVIPGGTYAASDAAGLEISLAALFDGELTAGDWTLFMSDNAQDSEGSIDGWGLSITSSAVPEPGTATILGLAGLACLARRRR